MYGVITQRLWWVMDQIILLKNLNLKIKREGIDFLSLQRDWKMFEQNNGSIAPNVLFASQNSEEITHVHKPEHNFEQENYVFLLMINDDLKKYYYFAVKNKLELYSSEWLRNKKKVIINGDNCFQNALDEALNYQNIKKDPQRISKIKPYISQYNWKDIEFPSHQKDWKKFEQNNKAIALNILFVPHNTKTISLAYTSKYNHKCKNQVILLMITYGKKWHYLAVKSLSALLRGITSNNNGDFYWLNCFHSYCTHNKLKKHERVCDNRDYCHVDMPTEDDKILKYNLGEKSLRAPFIITADLECILKKEQSCQNNLENSYTEKKAKHEPSGYSWSLICSFDATKSRHNFYRGKDCIEKFCKDVKELAIEISNYRDQEMIPLTDEEIKFYKKQKVCRICKKEFCYDKNKESEFRLYQKVRDHCHYTQKFRVTAHNVCNL